jgi:anti-sigma B factor antagonist
MQNLELTITASPTETSEAQILKISGPMLISNLFAFQDAVRAQGAPLLVLDLTEGPYMDSAALGSVVNAHVSCSKRNRRLALVGVCDRVAMLFKVVNVDKVFAIYRSLPEALQAVGSSAK